MMRAPDWTNREFEKVPSSGSMDASELARSLPRRSVGAVQVVQHGIHSYHLGQESSMLSEMMLDRFADGKRPVICPICGDVVGR
jgi:hypothetical protein